MKKAMVREKYPQEYHQLPAGNSSAAPYH